MPTQIEQDASLVVQALAEWSEQDNDPNVGHYLVSGEELQGKLGISPNRINDAIEYLVERGHVSRSQSLGSAPYTFREVGLETAGRLAYQQSQILRVEEDQVTATAYDVFLSHSSLDDQLASDVKGILEANALVTFATPGSIPSGKWEPQIEDALRNSVSIWVLLTPAALRDSVWVHHEFGYFYGYGHGVGRDPAGQACRFLYTEGTELRGLYREILGVKIDSIEDPTQIAQTIAEEMGVPNIKVPHEYLRRKYPIQRGPSPLHPKFGRIRVSGTGTSGDEPDARRVNLHIQATEEVIYNVSALTAHPELDFHVHRSIDVVGPDVDGEVQLKFKYRKERFATVPDTSRDSYGRVFALYPGDRAPQGTTPLLLTFETEDGRPLAAVFYYTVTRHQKGFPDFELRTALPMDWREGRLG
jgi:hypothetical protein